MLQCNSLSNMSVECIDRSVLVHLSVIHVIILAATNQILMKLWGKLIVMS